MIFMHGRGAKGSMKDRIYQFWLISLFLEKKKKRKQQKLLKKKRKEEEKKKWERELFYNQKRNSWKLSKSPAIFRKKEGIIVTLYPIGKKPDKVVEVIEKKSVGIAPVQETEKGMIVIAAKVVKEACEELEKKPKEKKEWEDKNNKLKQHLEKIEVLKKQYQTVLKKKPKVANSIEKVPNDQRKTTFKKSMLELEQVERLCKQEISHIEKVLLSPVLKPERKQPIVTPETKNFEKERIAKLNPNVLEHQQENKKVAVQMPKKIVPTHSTAKEIKNKKASLMVLAGGTVVAFPALLQAGLNQKKVSSEMKKQNNPKSQPKKREIDLNQKTQNNEKEQKTKKRLKLKLYKNKLQASKESEILIQSEIKRQKDYLKHLNEKVSKLNITVKKKYHFRGLHHVISNVLKFTLGILTIPFSRKKVFGTIVGITLINNSIRGLKNSFKKEEEQIPYIQFKDLSNMIYSEKMAILRTKDLIVDSLNQLTDLKNELETEFYGKVSFAEYEEMKLKIASIEETLVQKQKEVLEAQNNLEKVEEKNKVKMKKMEAYWHR